VAEPATLRERLLARLIVTDSGCWLWTGALDAKGYGVIGKGRREEGLLATHVASYELHVGPIPDGLVLDHSCRRPACVNPEHLEPVTNAENGRRGARAKLTHAQVAEIRDLVAGGRSQASVARAYGVHSAHVSRIVNAKRWGDARPIRHRVRSALS
jgi:hypothetical protein